MTAVILNNLTLKEWEEEMNKEFQLSPNDTFGTSLRKRVFKFLTEPTYSTYAYIWSVLMTFVIIGSVASLVLQTVYDLSNTTAEQNTFFNFEMSFTIIFLFEYLLRTLSCPNYKYLPRLVTQPSWIIDVIAILPFFIELILADSNASSMAVIRVVRLFRVFRLFKAHKNAQQVVILANALKRSKDGVYLLLFLMINLMFISASFVYFCEQSISERSDDGIWYYTDGVLKGSASQFQSIPHALWWAIVTLCTVGYGDMYPTSGSGKFFGALTMFCGALCLGFPTTIIGIHMSELYFNKLT
eukprot:NODE_241_length_13209_cov_0.424256.p4 type:complete len:299 gc:universal NODE_241_length_13209_cov_0.424256:12958-12062(-)